MLRTNHTYSSVLFFLFGLVAGFLVNVLTTGNLSPTFLLTKNYYSSWNERNMQQSTDGSPMTHEQVNERDQKESLTSIRKFEDQDKHRDDTSVADQLYKDVKIFCWVLTHGYNHKIKAVHVKATWAKRCNFVIFMSDREDASLPSIKLPVEKGRAHLTNKTMQAFDYAYKHYINDFDWFIKADDDTYVIMENLRYLLSAHSPNEPVFFGHHFKSKVKQGYFSGGGGYVISKESLRRFGNRKPNLCAQDFGAEDMEFGRCMERLHVKTGDSHDNLGRSRFHCFNPLTHLKGNYPGWYYKRDIYGGRKGQAAISDYPVTFHYMSANQMYELEFYVYHLRLYGIVTRNMDLNLPPKTETRLFSNNSTPMS